MLLGLTTWAGLPPTTSQVSGDPSKKTTFDFLFPNFTGTHTGTSVSLGVNGVAGGGTGLSSAPTNGQLLIGNGTNYSLSTITGTTNQVNVTNGAGTVTLATPQDIGTNSTPTFDEIILDNAQFGPSGIHVGDEIAHTHSTALVSGGLLTINADTSKFDLSAGEAVKQDYATDPVSPTIHHFSFAGGTAISVTNLATADQTYILIDTAGTIIQQTTPPTASERRANVYIGRLNHPNHTSILAARSLPDYIQAQSNQFFDFLDALGAFNVSGNVVSANGANLSINKSAGVVFRRSVGYQSDDQQPHTLAVAAASPATLLRTTQTVINTTPQTTLDVTNYDNAGTVTAIGGGSGNSTIQRIYLFPSGIIAVHYGQNVYSSLAAAIEAISTSTFIQNPTVADGATLIAYVVVSRTCTSLLDTSCSRILPAARFDVGAGGGSSSVTTLQGAYNNSSQPQLTVNSTLLGIQIRDAATPIGSSLFAIQDNAGTTNYLNVDVNGLSTTNFVGSGTAGAVRVHNLTTAQRTALTAAAGMIVWDTTLSQFLGYDGTAWRQMTGEFNSSDLTLTATDTLAISLTHSRQTWLIQGNAGPITMSTTPFGATDPVNGAEINLIGNSDANTVTFVTNDAANGIIGYGFTLGRGQMATLKYNSTLDRYVIKSVSN